MAEIGRWHDRKFEISASTIRSFNDLKLKTVADFDTVDSYGQQYLKRKNWKPVEISFTIHLHAGLGYNVRDEATWWTTFMFAGQGSSPDYFYVGNKKLFHCSFIMTDATISEIEIAANGTWTAADVAVTMKQAALLDGTVTTPAPSASSSSNSGGGYSAAAGSKKQTVTPTKTTAAKTVASALPTATMAAVTAAVSSIKSITATAKTTSAAAKKTGSMKKNYVALPM